MSPAGDRTPYDRFFRKAFGRPEAARELALSFVPADYYELISAARITVEPNRFVDETLADLTEAELHGSLRTITALLFMKYVEHSLLRVGRQMLEVR